MCMNLDAIDAILYKYIDESDIVQTLTDNISVEVQLLEFYMNGTIFNLVRTILEPYIADDYLDDATVEVVSQIEEWVV